MDASKQVNTQAEQAIIGAIIVEAKKVIPVLLSKMEADYFSNDALRIAYQELIQMFGKHGKVDTTPILHLLEDFSAEEGRNLFLSCVQLYDGFNMLPGYIKAVAECYQARVLSTYLTPLVLPGINPSNVEVIMAGLSDKLMELMQGSSKKQLVSIEEIAIKQYPLLFDKPEQLWIRTGLETLNNLIRGFRGKTLTLLAARPSVGKSALAMNFSVAFARQKKKVGFFSLEMSEEELFERYLAYLSKINLDVIQQGDFGEYTVPKVSKASNELAGLDIYINDDGYQTVESIWTQAKLRNLDVVIVDYLQLITPTGYNSNRTAEVSKISRELKQMATDLDIPVIALSQLNRNKEEDEEPMLSDLRDSGSLEQDANTVIFLWLNGEQFPGETLVACKVAKNRNGKKGEFVARYNGGLMTFTDTSYEVTRKKKKAKDAPWEMKGDWPPA